MLWGLYTTCIFIRQLSWVKLWDAGALNVDNDYHGQRQRILRGVALMGLLAPLLRSSTALDKMLSLRREPVFWRGGRNNEKHLAELF